MTDYTDLIARLRAADPMQVIGWDGREAAAAIEAMQAENERLRKAAERALQEAVADDMDEWFADLRAAITGSPR